MYVEIAFPCALFLFTGFVPGRRDSGTGSIRSHTTHNPKRFHEPAVRKALNVLFGHSGIANLYPNRGRA